MALGKRIIGFIDRRLENGDSLRICLDRVGANAMKIYVLLCGILGIHESLRKWLGWVGPIALVPKERTLPLKVVPVPDA